MRLHVFILSILASLTLVACAQFQAGSERAKELTGRGLAEYCQHVAPTLSPEARESLRADIAKRAAYHMGREDGPRIEITCPGE